MQHITIDTCSSDLVVHFFFSFLLSPGSQRGEDSANMEFPTVNGVQVFRLPPPGYEVNFEHPRSNKVMEHYLIFGLMGPLAFVALLQRYYTKIFLSKGLQVDDCEI